MFEDIQKLTEKIDTLKGVWMEYTDFDRTNLWTAQQRQEFVDRMVKILEFNPLDTDDEEIDSISSSLESSQDPDNDEEIEPISSSLESSQYPDNDEEIENICVGDLELEGETSCLGCFYDSLGQRNHMGPGGCLEW